MGIFDRQIIETIFCNKNSEGKLNLLPIEEIAKKCTRLHPESAELYDEAFENARKSTGRPNAE